MTCQFLQDIKDKVLAGQEIGDYQWPSEQDSVSQEDSNLRYWLEREKVSIVQIRNLIREKFNLNFFVKRYVYLVKLFYRFDYSTISKTTGSIIYGIRATLENKYSFIYQDTMMWFENNMEITNNRFGKKTNPTIYLDDRKISTWERDYFYLYCGVHILYDFNNLKELLEIYEQYFEDFFTVSEWTEFWNKQGWKITSANIYALDRLDFGEDVEEYIYPIWPRLDSWGDFDSDVENSYRYRIANALLEEEKRIFTFKELSSGIEKNHNEMKTIISNHTDALEKLQNENSALKQLFFETMKEYSEMKTSISRYSENIEKLQSENSIIKEQISTQEIDKRKCCYNQSRTVSLIRYSFIFQLVLVALLYISIFS